MDPATISALIAAGVDVSKMLYDAFKPQPKNPASAAQPWLEKAGDIYKPYMQQGQEAYNTRNPIFNQMATDPQEHYAQLMEGYQPSDQYKQRKENILTGAANSAAAGGMRGGVQDVMNQSRLADSLLNADMGDWFKQMSGIENAGLEGLGDTYNKGYGAASDLANTYGSQGNLELLSQMLKNQQSQGNQNSFWSGLGDLGGLFSGLFGKQKSQGPQGDVFLPSNAGSNYSLGTNMNTPNINMNQYPWMR